MVLQKESKAAVAGMVDPLSEKARLRVAMPEVVKKPGQTWYCTQHMPSSCRMHIEYLQMGY